MSVSPSDGKRFPLELPSRWHTGDVFFPASVPLRAERQGRPCSLASLASSHGTIARLTYTTPRLIAQEKLSDYTGAEVCRDVLLIFASSPIFAPCLACALSELYQAGKLTGEGAGTGL